MKTVLYWSPCLTKIGTIKSTINSAIALSKYSKNECKVKIINSCGEWDEHIDTFKANNIDVINFKNNFFSYLPKNGFLKSRISYLIIILFSFLPLIKILKKDKPEFIIMHLITSLPLFINNFFKLDTKFILRISGFPKLNIWRKILWKFSAKKIYKVTCPTQDLFLDLKKKKIFPDNKLFYLQDAIINIKDYIKFKNQKVLYENERSKNFFLSVGRLTKQKNYSYLISEFSQHLKIYKNDLLYIVGEGEEKSNLTKQIFKNNLTKNIFLLGKRDNIYSYMKNAKALILSSLWEEIGFVIVEAAFSNLLVISSDCPNGPTEFLENGRAGYLYKSNKKNELSKKLEKFNKEKEEVNLKNFIIKAKKNSSNYTLFRHYLNLKEILKSENKI